MPLKGPRAAAAPWGARSAASRSLLLLAVLAAGAVASGCGTTQSCTLVGCLDGVDVTVSGFGSAGTFVTQLPVTLTACVGSACSSFRIDKTGGAPTCTGLNGAATLCTLDDQGTLVLTGLPFPSGVGASVSVEVTVTAKTSTLFDGKATTTVTATMPNGPGCGVCDQATPVSFAPP